MIIKKLLRGICALALCAAFALPSGASAQELRKVATAWMGAQETFPIWYAKDQGWDKELGLDLSLLYFSSGMDSLNTLPSGSWAFAGVGAIPAVIGALHYDISVIGLGNDESAANAVLVRKDSEIAKVKGYNKAYPEVYGTPDTVRGKTFFCTSISSAHYTLNTWLKALGLNEKDVNLMNMEQVSALAAFEYGLGDGVALWAPLTYVGTGLGWQIAATPSDTGSNLPLLLVANRAYAEANPDVTAKFLQLYMRGIDHMKSTPMDKLVDEYLRFYLEWAGSKYSRELALRDLGAHSVFTLDTQLAFFDDSKGPSRVQQLMSDIAVFFADNGKITRQELAKISSSAYVTGKYLKMLPAPTEQAK